MFVSYNCLEKTVSFRFRTKEGDFMENSTKKTLSIISAIASIILGALEFIAAIANISALDELRDYGYDVDVYEFLYVIDLVMGILLIVFASMTLSQKNRYRKGYSVTILVFLSIILFAQFYSMATSFSGLQIVGLLLILLAFITKIVEMTIKSGQTETEQETKADFNGFYDYQEPTSHPTEAKPTSTSQTIGDKCLEIKHLKDLGIIDEEQYQKAINKVLEGDK